MYYINENESLYQQLVTNNQGDYDGIIEEIGFLLDVWHDMYKGKKIMFASPFEMLIFLNDLVIMKDENKVILNSESLSNKDILFDKRSLDYNKLVYFKMRALIDKGRLSNAIEFAEEVKDVNPCCSDISILQANALLLMGEAKDAFDLANMVLANSYEPRQAGYCYKIMAEARSQQGDYRSAKIYYTESNVWVKDLCVQELKALSKSYKANVSSKEIQDQLVIDSSDFPSQYIRMMTYQTLELAKKNNYKDILAYVALTFQQIFKETQLEEYLKEPKLGVDKNHVLSREFLCGKMSVLL
jgi:hypothetical protein